jgi:hypothetical protein
VLGPQAGRSFALAGHPLAQIRDLLDEARVVLDDARLRLDPIDDLVEARCSEHDGNRIWLVGV